MPTLHDLQSDFRRFLTGEAPEQLFHLIDGVGFEPESRLSIYRNNMLVTLTAVLKATFPVVCRLVDDRFFEFAANSFIQDNLPSHPCLVEYGSKFPAFLSGFGPAACLGYLPDVARLEWAINRVLHAPCPALPMSVASLLSARGDPAEIRLTISSESRYVASAYPIDWLWQNNQPGIEPGQMSLDRGSVHLEVRRMDGLRFVQLSPEVWTFRSLMADGATLGQAATEALAMAPSFDLAQALAAFFDAGLVLGL